MSPRSRWRRTGRLATSRLLGTERDRQGGAVLVLVAIAFFAICGAVGLGIDGGRMFEERRAAQAAADHAALAAAHARCSGATDAGAIVAGKAVAALNGFDDAAPTIGVAIAAVAGQVITFRAVVDTTIEATFARAIGFDDLHITVEATGGGTGCVDGIDPPGAMYAGGTCEAGKGLDLAGSDMLITGGIHANADLLISGSNSEFTEAGAPADPVTFVDAVSVSGSNNTFEAVVAPALPYPRDVGAALPSPQWVPGWAPSDLNAAMLATYKALAQANGRYYGPSATPPSTINKDGVWYVERTSEWNITGVSGTRNVVLVAHGEILLSRSDVTLNAYSAAGLPRQNMLMISTKIHSGEPDKCSKHTIKVSGQNLDWTGVMWAPGGLVEFSGSDNSTGEGSLVGWGVKVSGQNVTLKSDPAAFTDTPRVLLLK